MRKNLLVALLGVAVALTASAAFAGNGPWKVDSWQFGVPASNIEAGTSFQIRGAGFHARVHPVKVCITGSYCELAVIDRAGEFMMTRTLDVPGEYEVTVSMARDMKLTTWVDRASKKITVK